MTQDLFRQDSYLSDCQATVTDIPPQGIVLDRTVFYPLGGGQAGDAGVLQGPDGQNIAIIDTRKGKAEDGSFNKDICHLPTPDVLATLLNPEQSIAPWLTVGSVLTARIDWARRHRLMRFHTSTHLLCHLVPQLVNGCSITPDYARLDFNMTDALDKDQLTAGLAKLVASALPLLVGEISDAELDANPALVKSMSVQPPRGSGRVLNVASIAGFQPDQVARHQLLTGQALPLAIAAQGHQRLGHLAEGQQGFLGLAFLQITE
jgi:misacylated tRNA(Ala) deacylase